MFNSTNNKPTVLRVAVTATFIAALAASPLAIAQEHEHGAEHHAETDGLPVLVRADLAHVQFETIHPFLDGNGRVGRLLITFLLLFSAFGSAFGELNSVAAQLTRDTANWLAAISNAGPATHIHAPRGRSGWRAA